MTGLNNLIGALVLLVSGSTFSHAGMACIFDKDCPAGQFCGRDTDGVDRCIPVYKEKIAFHAYTNASGYFSPGEVVIFPNILYNDGAGYDGASGNFTAPVSGVYHFTAHICNAESKYMVINIMKEDHQIAVTSSYASLAGCNSVSTVAKVKKNEHVFVVARFEGSQMFSDGNRRPSFMGFLLYEKE